MRQDKTIAEISDNIREAVKMLGDDVSYVVSAGQMRNLANLLDKAAIRERAEAATKAATDAINLTEEKWRRQCADMAKLREALEKCAKMGEQIDCQLGSSDATVYAFRDERCLAHNISECARAALAEPPRNCDVLTPEVLLNEFINEMPEEVAKKITKRERDLIELTAAGVIETLFATHKPIDESEETK